MDWIEHNGVTVGIFIAIALHWIRMEVRLAVMKRDLEWMRATLNKWGFHGPETD